MTEHHTLNEVGSTNWKKLCVHYTPIVYCYCRGSARPLENLLITRQVCKCPSSRWDFLLWWSRCMHSLFRLCSLASTRFWFSTPGKSADLKKCELKHVIASLIFQWPMVYPQARPSLLRFLKLILSSWSKKLKLRSWWLWSQPCSSHLNQSAEQLLDNSSKSWGKKRKFFCKTWAISSEWSGTFLTQTAWLSLVS